jgi:hypothetical protein
MESVERVDALLRHVIASQKSLAEVVFTVRYFNELLDGINELSTEVWTALKEKESLETQLQLKEIALMGYETGTDQEKESLRKFKELTVESIESLRARHQDLESQYAKWQGMLERQKEENSFLNERLKEACQEKETLREGLASCQNSIKKMESEKRLAVESMNRVQGINDTLSRRLEEAKTEISELKQAKDLLHQQREKDKDKEARERENKDKIEKERQVELAEQRRQIVLEKDQEIVKLKNEIKDKELTIKELKSTSGEIRSTLEALRSEKDELERGFNSMREISDKNQVDKEAAQEMIHNLRLELERLKSQSDKFIRDERSTTDQLSKKAKEIEKLEDKLADMKKKLDSKTEAHKELTTRNRELESKLKQAEDSDEQLADIQNQLALLKRLVLEGTQAEEVRELVEKMLGLNEKKSRKGNKEPRVSLPITSKTYFELARLALENQELNLQSENHHKIEVKNKDEDTKKVDRKGKKHNDGNLKIDLDKQAQIVDSGHNIHEKGRRSSKNSEMTENSHRTSLTRKSRETLNDNKSTEPVAGKKPKKNSGKSGKSGKHTKSVPKQTKDAKAIRIDEERRNSKDSVKSNNPRVSKEGGKPNRNSKKMDEEKRRSSNSSNRRSLPGIGSPSDKQARMALFSGDTNLKAGLLKCGHKRREKGCDECEAWELIDQARKKK